MPPAASSSALHPATRAIHEGNRPCPTTGAILQPLVMSTTFEQRRPGSAQPAGYTYGRDGNPNREALEAVLASLDYGHSAYAVASGTAATSLVVQAIGANAHCLAIQGIYSGTEEYLLRVAGRGQGWTTSFCPFDSASDDEIYGAIRPETRVIWLEACGTNPLLAVADVANVSRIARSHPSRPLVVVDSTFSSPYFSNPLLRGADIVIHSTTKYVAGHTDVIGGVVVLRDGLPQLAEDLRWLQSNLGATPSAFDCYLIQRSIKTLAIRCIQHGLSALRIAAHLEAHPLVESVLYPGLKTHPHHQRARDSLAADVWRDLKSRTGWKQDGVPYSGMLSFTIKGPDSAAEAFIQASRLFTLAESLGGVESLAKVPWLMSTSLLSDAERRKTGLSPALVRMSVGLEDVEDLLADIDQALEAAVRPPAV